MTNAIKIIRVPIPTPTLFPHTTTNSYLIGNEKETLLVDAGYDNEFTKEQLDKELAKHQLATPTSILLTHAHPDHAPGVRRLTEWNPTVYCHEKEKAAILAEISPWNKIELVNDGDTLTIAGEKIEVMHTPGHTVGHLSLYIPSKKILIAGDNVVAEGTTWIGAPDGDMKDYLETMRRLKDLDLDKIGPGHGDWVLQAEKHIDFVIERRLLREEQITSLLKEHGKLTSTELTNLIYKDTIHPSVFHVAKRTIEAHLDKLIKEKAIQLDDLHYISANL